MSNCRKRSSEQKESINILAYDFERMLHRQGFPNPSSKNIRQKTMTSINSTYVPFQKGLHLSNLRMVEQCMHQI